MAKPLILTFAGAEIPFFLNRVERSDLYGFIETEALDEKGRKCTLATLAPDGKHVIGSGGSAFALLSPSGNWLDRKALIPTNSQGQRITPVPSSYAAPVPLAATATIEEYLSHNIRAVYEIATEADISPLLAELKKGTIFHFPYSFRGGLEPDAGFLLLAADGTPFIAIGTPTKLEFVALAQTAPTVSEEDAPEDDEDTLDFSMM